VTSSDARSLQGPIVHLKRGTSTFLNDQRYTVLRVGSDGVQLQDMFGATQVVDPAFLAGPGIVIGARAFQAVDVTSALANLTPEQTAEVEDRIGHINEVLTGFRSGRESVKLPGEPRPEYGRHAPLMDKYQAKANELGKRAATIQRWKLDFEKVGPSAFVDRRKLRPVGTFPGIDVRYIEALQKEIENSAGASNRTGNGHMIAAEARIEAEFGVGVVPLPKKTAAYELFEALTVRRYTTGASTKTKQQTADRGVTRRGSLKATRPGEFVLMDSSPLDVLIVDRASGCRYRPNLNIAIDVFSRCIVGVTLSTGGTNSMDVALLLLDIMSPRPAPDYWEEGTKWPYIGRPSSLLLWDKESKDYVWGQGLEGPGIFPETLVVDHGKAYVSRHVQSICQYLGISLQTARPYTGQDKSQVERMFRTLNTGLMEHLRGYVGSSVHDRGKRAEDGAYLFIDDAYALIREWIATVYHRRVHSSLRIPGDDKNTTPFQMLSWGIEVAGYLPMPAHADLLVQLLPIKRAIVQHYGVDMNTLVYNGPVLDEFRHQNDGSDRNGKKGWEFRYNPDDLRWIWFVHPRTNEVHKLQSTTLQLFDVPFSERALRIAKNEVKVNHQAVDVRRKLHDLLTNWSPGPGSSRREQQAMRRQNYLTVENGRNLSLDLFDPSHPDRLRFPAIEQRQLTALDFHAGLAQVFPDALDDDIVVVDEGEMDVITIADLFE
jgi:transposase InsO family protein